MAITVTPAASPRELGHAEITATATNASGATPADVAGLSVTFVAGSRPVWLEASGIAGSDTANRQVNLTITNSANAIVAYGQMSFGTATFTGTVLAKVRLSTLTPGTQYTYKCRINLSAAGTSSLAGDPTFRPYLVAYEAGT